MRGFCNTMILSLPAPDRVRIKTPTTCTAKKFQFMNLATNIHMVQMLFKIKTSWNVNKWAQEIISYRLKEPWALTVCCACIIAYLNKPCQGAKPYKHLAIQLVADICPWEATSINPNLPSSGWMYTFHGTIGKLLSPPYLAHKKVLNIFLDYQTKLGYATNKKCSKWAKLVNF